MMIDVDRISKFYVSRETLQPFRVALSLSRTERDVQVLSNISLSVRRGEILGIIGRNGSGKSTLLRVVGGIIEPSEGQVVVRGTKTGLYELGLASHRGLTGREYARRLFSLYGIESNEIESLIDEAQDFSELGEFFERPLRSYSSGMLARLFFSVVTAKKSDVLLVDEALSVGDEYFQNKCWRKIRSLLQQGVSGILVTHDWAAIVKLCDRALVLDEGRLASAGPAPNVIRDYLQLPRPAARESSFGEIPNELEIEMGQPIRLRVPIEGPDLEYRLAFSIELMEKGRGWIVISSHDGVHFRKQQESGFLDANLMPGILSAGEYLLNLFLLSEQGEVLDSRGWLYGNPIRLRVRGDKSLGLLNVGWNRISNGN